MDHQIYKEWIPLALENELSAHENAELQNHIAGCFECQAEYEEQKQLKQFLSANKPAEPDEHLLFEARQGLRNAVRKERSRVPKLAGILKIFTSRKFQVAFGGVAVLLVGFFAGYIMFKQNIPQAAEQAVSSSDGRSTILHTVSGKPIGSDDSFSLSQTDVRITNIRFIDQDASDGQIEFVFDAVKPVRMKGSINDERIKNVLMYSMLNTENPGVRLNSINVLGAGNKSKVDSETKTALISVAKFDQNPGVRREAIKLLSKFNSEEDVKNTLLYVLANDKISGNRIEAINSLMEAQKEGVKFNENELSVFKEKMKGDENNYIRYQAKTVLQENK